MQPAHKGEEEMYNPRSHLETTGIKEPKTLVSVLKSEDNQEPEVMYWKFLDRVN